MKQESLFLMPTIALQWTFTIAFSKYLNCLRVRKQTDS